jgi:DNA-binding NtrC family response regulator
VRSTIIPNVKIAVVDHDELTRNFIANVMMYSVNREILKFEDSKGILRHIEKEGAIDLILSETRLPGISGLELLEKVKKILPKTRFIALSADPGDETMASSLGADAFLAKPFLLQDLFNIVQRFIVDESSTPT